VERFGHAADHVDKILHGPKPGNRTIEQTTEFELVFNLTSAKALGITFPPSFPAHAELIG